MIDRRQLLSSTMAAGLLGFGESARGAAVEFPPGEPGDAQSQRDLADLSKAVDSMSALVAAAITEWRHFPEIAPIRTAQKDYLIKHAKLPDIIEVGVDVWFNVYDWHIKWQQPPAMGRDANNRRTIILFETAVVMQIDQPPNYVGMPYDRG